MHGHLVAAWLHLRGGHVSLAEGHVKAAREQWADCDEGAVADLLAAADYVEGRVKAASG